MIYEVRTYTLRPGTVAEFDERDYFEFFPLPAIYPKRSHGSQT